ncbi:MAG TPA: hypothetical protein VIH59_03360 [Candidatus Tectomicrobia bacterium]
MEGSIFPVGNGIGLDPDPQNNGGVSYPVLPQGQYLVAMMHLCVW